MRPGRAWILATMVAVVAGPASHATAQERPPEDEMFGGGAETHPASPPATLGPAPAPPPLLAPLAPSTAGSAAGNQDARDDLNLSDPKAATRFSGEVAPEDPLKMGGQFYWRVMTAGKRGQYPQDWNLSAPALLDVYMDARPNERVRAFVLGRMSYDPTLAPNGTTSSGAGAAPGSVQNSDSLTAMSGQPTRGPNVALDQLWLRFDLLRTVFVTAGKQHVRWGTARFWAPTDYLHVSPRNPLLPFDPRTGTTMLKLHLPWEARGWNFYAYAIPESATTTSRPADIAGALRTEIVLGTFEAGLGVFGRRNSKAKFAGDFSFGLWDLDFYGEAALRNAGDVDFAHYKADSDASTKCGQLANLNVPQLVETYFPADRGSGWKAQATGGVSYTRQYADKDTFTVGAEYFYNGLGYSSPKDYPGLVLQRPQPLANAAAFFYLGRHYLGVFATAPAPYSWDNTTFTLSLLANLSDKSAITRLDYSLIVLTHVRFEAYGAVRFGQENGEFRLGFNSNDLPCPPKVPTILLPGTFDLGVGLRVAL